METFHETSLRFRRTFQDVMDVKGWTTPDIMMEEESRSMTTTEVYGIELPLPLK